MTDDDGRRHRFEHRRGEVLQAATDHVLEHGLAGLSLRRLGEHVGISHATLLHHFGSKEQLVAEIVESILGAALAAPSIADDETEPLVALWNRARSPRGRRLAAAFLEISVTASRTGGPLRDAVDRSIEGRVSLMADGLVRAGCARDDARPLATFILASLRGLVIDLLNSADDARVDEAFDVLREVVEARLERSAKA